MAEAHPAGQAKTNGASEATGARAAYRAEAQVASKDTVDVRHFDLEGDQSAVEMMRTAFASRLDVMYDGLVRIPGISCVRPDGAFYLFPSIKGTGLDSLTFSQRFLEEEQVAVVPGVSFGADEHIRFSYATDLATIEKGVERLGRFVNRLKPGR